MKIAVATLGLALLSAAVLRADTVLIQKVERAGQTGEMTVKIKGTKIRADIAAEISTITDTASGMETTLMHAQKVYMQMSADATRQLLKNVQAAQKETPKAEPEPALQATGQHETVNGYDTEIYTTAAGSMKSRYWIAKDYPDAAKFLGVFKQLHETSLSRMVRKMAVQPIDFPGVPLKAEITLPQGQKLTMTLVSIKDQPVDDAEFVIPADYKALPTPSFGAPPPR